MEKLALERRQQGGCRVTAVTIAHEMDAELGSAMGREASPN